MTTQRRLFRRIVLPVLALLTAVSLSGCIVVGPGYYHPYRPYYYYR